MSGGYTPVFQGMFDGTLCGKFPAGPVWASLMAFIDKRGCIDQSYQAIAARTGWPIDLLKEGIRQLMEPDPDSRSPAEGGRRLVPLDAERPWGWRVVNHGLYREKARQLSQTAAQVDDGRNAAKVRRYKDRKADEGAQQGLIDANKDTAGHPETPADTAGHSATPSSNSDADSDLGIRDRRNSGQEPASSRPSRPEYESRSFHDAIRDAYHEALPGNPKIMRWTKKRELALNTRIRERIAEGKADAGTVDYWRRFFAVVASRPFMLGDNDRGWMADIDFILSPSGFLKILEGKFKPRKGNGGMHATH